MHDVTATVKVNKLVAHKTYLMSLDVAKGFSDAKPGQFVMLRVGDSTDPLLRRPFSIAGIDEDGSLLVLYRVVGKGTALMSQWKPRTSTGVLGPLGRGFDFASKQELSIMVAGGIGIAPLLFLSHQLKSSKTILLMGAGKREELIPVEGLAKTGLEIAIATEDGSRGHRGLVTELLDKALNDVEVGQTMVYACGPEPMLSKVSSMCSGKGVRCQVSVETAMACGVGACQGCAVRSKKKQPAYYHVCKDGPVFDAEEIVWDIP